jgi:DNA-binding CsgD family transcriptional regulator
MSGGGRIGVAVDEAQLAERIAGVLAGGGYEAARIEAQAVFRPNWADLSLKAIVTCPAALQRQAREPGRRWPWPVILALPRSALPEHRFSLSIANSFVLTDENLDLLSALVPLSRFRLSFMPRGIKRGSVEVSPHLHRLSQLSSRDRLVLSELARGGTNHSIAARLGIPVSAAKLHIRRIVTKLGFRNRTDAAVFSATIVGDQSRSYLF